jgi:hypothetical protein
MANAIFGLFADGNAGKVFSEIGKTAQKSSKDTSNLALQVEKASIKMNAAADKEKASLAKVNIEQTKLNEMRQKGTASASSLLAQEERLAAAERSSISSISAAKRATQELATAETEANVHAKNLEHSTGSLGSKLASTTKLVGGLVGGFALFAGINFAKQSITAAEDFQTAQTKLKVAIKDTGRNIIDYQKPIQDVTEKLGKWGFKSTEVQDALAQMTIGLKDPTKAINKITTAANLAALKHISLAEAGLLVVKTTEGQIKGIKALGIDIAVAASGELKIKNAKIAHAKAIAHVIDLMKKQGTASNISTSGANKLSKAEEKLAHLQAKYGIEAKRTPSQLVAIQKAQEAVNKAMAFSGTTNGGSVAYQNQLAAAKQKVIDTQLKLNDAQTAGNQLYKGLDKATSGAAATAAAEDTATKLKILSNNFDELKIKFGTALLPAVTKVVDWLNTNGLKDVQNISKFFKTWGLEIKGVAGFLATAFVGGKVLTGISVLTKAFNGLKIAAGLAAGAEALAGSGGVAGAAGAGAGVGVAAIGTGAAFAAGAKVLGTKVAVVSLVYGAVKTFLDRKNTSKDNTTWLGAFETTLMKMGNNTSFGMIPYLNNSVNKVHTYAEQKRTSDAWVAKMRAGEFINRKATSLSSVMNQKPTIIIHQHIAGSVMTEDKLMHHIAKKIKPITDQLNKNIGKK